jgi:Spy/CpxP family protein refolding chaperone
VVKSIVVGMLVIPLVLAVSLVSSDARPRGASLQRLQTELGLSEDQVQAIRQLHQGQRDVRRQLHGSLRGARQELREAVLSGADASAVQAKTHEVQQLAAQAVQYRVDALQAVSQILTPEQREKLRQLRPTWH